MASFAKSCFPQLLENRHFTLYVHVLDNINKQQACFDSLSATRDTRQKMHVHSLNFFNNGRMNRYWYMYHMPSVFESQHKFAVKQSSCMQQKDSESCGVFCCLFAEQLCCPNKRGQP